MNAQNLLGMLASVSLLAVADAQAQEAEGPGIDTLDVTMQLMPEGATLPEAVTRVIELPEAAAEAARQNAARGLETANEARGGAEPPGLAIAAEARERGMEQAQEDRENAGRGPPDWAGPPDSPGPPDGVPDILPDILPDELPGLPDGVPDSLPEDRPGPPEVPGAPDTAGPPGN